MGARTVTVGGAVLGEVRQPSRRAARGNYLAQRRLDELHALIRHRHGRPPAGNPYWLRPLVDLLLWTAREAGRVLDAAGIAERVMLLCPEVDPEGLRTTCALALERPRRWTAAELGDWLGLTLNERKRLGIRTIRAAGDTPARAAARKRKADRERVMTKRRKDGARPRAEYLAQSAAAEARRLGVSERTIRRRRKAEAESVRTMSPIGTSPRTRDPLRTRPRFRSVGPGFSLLMDRGLATLARPLAEPDPEVILTPGARWLLGRLYDLCGSFDDESAGRR